MPYRSVREDYPKTEWSNTIQMPDLTTKLPMT